MPAPLDLTGKRFGSLVVMSAGPMVMWGRQMRAWVCRCDCGAVLHVPQNRLPHRDSIPLSHRVTACDDCRAKPCVVCGAPVPASSTAATCSPECHVEHKRRYHLAWYHHKHATDYDFVAGRRAKARERYRVLSAGDRRSLNKLRRQRDLENYGQDDLNAQARHWHAARMDDPDYREKRRQKSLQWRKLNLAKVRVYQNRKRREKRALDVLGQIGQILKDRQNDD